MCARPTNAARQTTYLYVTRTETDKTPFASGGERAVTPLSGRRAHRLLRASSPSARAAVIAGAPLRVVVLVEYGIDDRDASSENADAQQHQSEGDEADAD